MKMVGQLDWVQLTWCSLIFVEQFISLYETHRWYFCTWGYTSYSEVAFNKSLSKFALIVCNQARVKFIIQHCFIVSYLTHNIIYFFPNNQWLNKNYRCTLMNDVFSFSGSFSPLPNHVIYSRLFFVRDSVEIFFLSFNML